MELTGRQVIPEDRETVWAYLNDPVVLKACIPGCEELSGSIEAGFDAVVTQKVGPVRATFHGTVAVTDVDPPSGYRLVGEGKGGVAGYARGTAAVRLTEVEGGTELTYAVDAKIGGKLAQLGGRIVSGVAAKLADTFFENFRAAVSGHADKNVIASD